MATPCSHSLKPTHIYMVFYSSCFRCFLFLSTFFLAQIPVSCLSFHLTVQLSSSSTNPPPPLLLLPLPCSQCTTSASFLTRPKFICPLPASSNPPTSPHHHHQHQAPLIYNTSCQKLYSHNEGSWQSFGRYRGG